MTLSPEQMQRVYAIQTSMAEKFKNTPKEGKRIEYRGTDFFVYPTVFWPGEDSKALIENYVINSREEVCDVCTGSGVIACYSAWKGARRVVALDINPNAVMNTLVNATRHMLEEIIEPRVSDVFSALRPGEQFDVVTMNSPFTEHLAAEHAERGCWDQDLHVQRRFFEDLNGVLKPNGRAYVTQANFGAIENMFERADKSGYYVREIGRNHIDDLRTFYAFELKRKSDVVQELAR